MKDFFKNKSRVLFILAFFVSQLVPYILQSGIVLATRHSLSDFVYLICQVSGVLCLFGIGLLAVKQLGVVHKGELRYSATYIVASVFALLLSAVFSSSFIGLVLFFVFIILGLTRGYKGIKIKLVVSVFVILDILVTGLVSSVFENITPSIFIQVLSMLINSLVSGVVFHLLFSYIAKKTVDKEWNNAKLNLRLLPAYVVSIFCFIIFLVATLSVNKAERMSRMVNNFFVSGAEYLMDSDIESALAYTDLTIDYVNTLYYVSDLNYNENKLNKTLRETRANTVKYLIWEKRDSYREMETYYLEENPNVDLGMRLLDHYHDDEKVDHEELTDKVIRQMMAEYAFTNNNTTVQDLQGYGEFFSEELPNYEKVVDFSKELGVVQDAVANNGINQKDMMTLLEYADKYENSLIYQYIAIHYGLEYKSDNARHYEGTGRCIERVAEYFKEFVANDVSKGQELYTWAVGCLTEIGQYENALKYVDILLELNPNDEESIISEAFCYYKLGKPDECIEAVSKLPDDNYYASYYRATSLIMKGQDTEALEEMVRYCDLLKASPDEKQDIENLLYELVQKAVLTDYTVKVHSYGFYEPNSEEQQQIIGDNEFLRQYLNAMYYCYEEKSYEDAEKAIQAVLGVDNELLGASYLAGIIYMDMEEYDKATEYLKKVVEYKEDHTSAWYALSYIYDATGQYEEAYNCCLKIKELVPNTDHDFDVYGIGYHNDKLLKELEEVLGVVK